MAPRVGLVFTLVVALSASCALPVRRTLPPPAWRVSLWEEPTDLESRDLYYGPWGREHAPDPNSIYRLVQQKHSGVNPGMKVKDPEGRQWSVKQSPTDGTPSEGPIEVAISRLLSAVGYHQPPVYYLRSFRLKDDWGIHIERGGRFRLKERTLKERGDWSFEQNPFIGTPSYNGLLVILMMVASSDLKASNNSVYEARTDDVRELRYVVRDLGTALGDTSHFAPQRGNPHVFARHRVFNRIKNGFVEFNFHGWHSGAVHGNITAADVTWASDLLSRLTAAQWADAFRAGGYTDDVAAQFITTVRANIASGRRMVAETGQQKGG